MTEAERILAHHEAAHTVVARAIGATVAGVWLCEEGRQFNGARGCAHVEFTDDAQRDAAVYLAGSMGSALAANVPYEWVYPANMLFAICEHRAAMKRTLQDPPERDAAPVPCNWGTPTEATPAAVSRFAHGGRLTDIVCAIDTVRDAVKDKPQDDTALGEADMFDSAQQLAFDLVRTHWQAVRLLAKKIAEHGTLDAAALASFWAEVGM